MGLQYSPFLFFLNVTHSFPFAHTMACLGVTENSNEEWMWHGMGGSRVAMKDVS